MPEKITSNSSTVEPFFKMGSCIVESPPAIADLSPEARRQLNREEAFQQHFTEITERGRAAYLEKDKKPIDRLKHVSKAVDIALIVIGISLAVIPLVQTQLWWTPFLQLGVVFSAIPIFIYIDYKTQSKQREYEAHCLLQPMLLPNKQLPALRPATEVDIPMMDPSLKWDRINKNALFNPIVEFEDSREIVHAAQNYDLEVSIPLKMFAAAKIGQMDTECKAEWKSKGEKVSILNKRLKARVLTADIAYEKYSKKQKELKQAYQKLLDEGDFSEEYELLDKKLDELMSLRENIKDYQREARAFFEKDREHIKYRMLANSELYAETMERLKAEDIQFFQRFNKKQRKSLGTFNSLSDEVLSQLSSEDQLQQVQKNNTELCFGIHNSFSQKILSQLPLEDQLQKAYEQIKELVRDRYERYLDQELVSKKFSKIEKKLDVLRDLYIKDQSSYEKERDEFLKDDYGLVKLTLVFELENFFSLRQQFLDLARSGKLKSLFLNNQFSIELQLGKANERMEEKINVFHKMYLDRGGTEEGFQKILEKVGVLLELKFKNETMEYIREKRNFFEGGHYFFKDDLLSQFEEYVQFCSPLLDLIQDTDHVSQLLSKNLASKVLLLAPLQKARVNYQQILLISLARYADYLQQERFSEDLDVIQDALNEMRRLSNEGADKEYNEAKALFLEGDQDGIKDALVSNLESNIAVSKKLRSSIDSEQQNLGYSKQSNWMLVRTSFGAFLHLSHQFEALKKLRADKEDLYKGLDFIKDENEAIYRRLDKEQKTLEKEFRPYFCVQKANDLLLDSFSEKDLDLLLHYLRTNDKSLRRISKKIRAIEDNRKQQSAAASEIFQNRKEGDVDLARLQKYREKEKELVQGLTERISRILENQEIDEAETGSEKGKVPDVLRGFLSRMQRLVISLKNCQKVLDEEIANHPLQRLKRIDNLLLKLEEKLEIDDHVLWTEKDDLFEEAVKKVRENYESLKARVDDDYEATIADVSSYEDFNNRVDFVYEEVLRLKAEREVLWESVQGSDAKWLSTESKFSRFVKEFFFDLPFFGETQEPIEHPSLQQHRFTQLRIQNLLEKMDHEVLTTHRILEFGFRWLPLAVFMIASSFFLYYYANPWVGVGFLVGDGVLTIGRFLLNHKMEQLKTRKTERKLQRLFLSPMRSNEKHLLMEERRLRKELEDIGEKIYTKKGISEDALAKRQKIKESLEDIKLQLQGVSRDPFYSRSKEVPGNRPDISELMEIERKFGLNLDAIEMTRGKNKEEVSKKIEVPKDIDIVKKVAQMAPIEDEFKDTLAATLDLTKEEAEKAYGKYLIAQKRDLEKILENSQNQEEVQKCIEEIDEKLSQIEITKPKRKKKSKVKQAPIELVEKYCRLSDEQREQIPEKKIQKLVSKLNAWERKKVYWSLPQKLREFMEDLSTKEFQIPEEKTLSFEGV